ncbi:MAG: NarK/NasA family nitrate transporter [Magnetococcales bacterium]|nr:NarK/NasA family nitrate transporter [Magnetococcales bacterium]
MSIAAIVTAPSIDNDPITTAFGARRTLLGAWIYTEVSFFVWILLGPLALFMADAWSLSRGEIGLLVSLPILAGTLLHLPIGLLTDRFGAWRVGLVVHGGLALDLVLLAWPMPMATPVLFVAAVFLGMAGVSFAVALPLVSARFPVEHQGKALGLTAFGGTGALLAAFIAPGLAESQGWRSVMALALGLVLFSGLMFGWTARHATAPRTHQPAAWSHYLHVLRHADTYWFCLFHAITFGGMVSLAASLVGYFHDQFRFSPSLAGTMATLCILASALFRPVGGWLADHWGGIRTLQVAFVTVALCVVLLTLLPPSAAAGAVALVAVVMSAFGAGNGALLQLLPIRFRRQMGVITGLVGAAGGLGGFLFVFAASGLQQNLAIFQPVFLFYGALGLLALVGLASVKRRWRTTWGAPRMTNARV